METCPRCGASLEEGAAFCTSCRWRRTQDPPQPAHARAGGLDVARYAMDLGLLDEAERKALGIKNEGSPAGAQPGIPPEPVGAEAREPPPPSVIEPPAEPEPLPPPWPVPHGPTARVPSGMPTWVVVAIVAVAVLLAGAVGALVRLQLDEGDPEGTLVARAPVGPEGATIPFGDGARLVVPRGAVDEAVVVTIRRLGADGADALGPVVDVSGAAYTFEPIGLRFREPVTVVFPVPEGAEAEVVVTIGESSRTLQAAADPEAGTIAVRILDFRSWTAAPQPRPGTGENR